MKESVDLNNNGLSIESTHKVLHRGKWVKRYIMCRKHTDLNDPILFIFKNKKDKQKNLHKFSLVLSNYVGYESANSVRSWRLICQTLEIHSLPRRDSPTICYNDRSAAKKFHTFLKHVNTCGTCPKKVVAGFEYKKRRNTLSLITAEVCLMMSFDLAESLVVWEAWLKNICGQTISFYMQLKKIPPSFKCTHAVLKEVRCHIKEGQLGVVYGRPQELLMLVDLRNHRVDVDENNLISVYYGEKPEEKVILLCPKSPHFKRCMGAARIDGALARMLNREQFEGDWMPEQKKSSVGDHTSQYTVNMSDLASLMRTPEPLHSHRISQNHKMMLPKGISKSGYFPPGYHNNSNPDYENLPYRPVSRANSTAAHYFNIIPANNHRPVANSASVHYVNIGSNHYGNGRRYSANEREVLSAKVSVPSTRSADEHPIYCNIMHNGIYPEEEDYDEIGSVGLRSTSMPEYVNVQIHHGVPHVVEETDPDQDWYENQEVIRRRSDNSVKSHNGYPSTSRGIVNNRGRSNPDFKSQQRDPDESKHESWRRAKKFFSAFKPKSQNDLKHSRQKNIIKSSSTGALHFSNGVNMFHRDSSSSETDENPPALNVSCHQMTRSQPMLTGMTHPPHGLVQAPNDIVLLKSRSGGVGAILARRKIRGSFTKYDGERATHMYQGQQTSIPKEDSIKEEEEPKEPEKPKPPPPRPPKIGKVVDGIASAVSRGQEKLKMTDRRTSNVSFHKINLDGLLPDGAVLSEKEGSSRPTSRADATKSEPDSKNLATTLPLPLSRNSNSHSDITRSSTESLSSDARSRISIRKKRSSPPRVTAPKLSPDPTYIHLQPHVIRLVPSSSVESCNSEQTARSFSPRSNHTRKSRNSEQSEHSLASATSHRTVFGNYIDLALPLQPQSSESNSSMASKHSADYVVIDPVSTQAIHDAATSHCPLETTRAMSSSMTGVAGNRRQSQGQGSSNSDTLSTDQQPKQGFFKKYRKVRRSKKLPGTSASMTQLNI